MQEAEKKLVDYMKEHNMDTEHLRFSVSCHSVAEAAEAVGATEDNFVKNICLMGPQGEVAVAIVRGKDRVDAKKVAKILDKKKMRMATAEEILTHTGYPCGGTPSFGFEAAFLMDKRVFDLSVVYTGGGSATSLVKSTPAVLHAANHAIIEDLIKE